MQIQARPPVLFGKDYKILLAEDNESFRAALAELLPDSAPQGDTFLIEEAADGAEAIEKLQQNTFDAVLTDNQMPRKTGLEVLAFIQTQLAGRRPKLVAMLSGDSVASKALAAGADMFFDKLDSLKAIQTFVKALTGKDA